MQKGTFLCPVRPLPWEVFSLKTEIMSSKRSKNPMSNALHFPQEGPGTNEATRGSQPCHLQLGHLLLLLNPSPSSRDPSKKDLPVAIYTWTGICLPLPHIESTARIESHNPSALHIFTICFCAATEAQLHLSQALE